MALDSPDSLEQSFDPKTIDRDTFAAYYQILELQPGATIEEVDRAYFRLKLQAKKDKDSPRVADLKIAHDRVKATLQYYFYLDSDQTDQSSKSSLSSTDLLIRLLQHQGLDAKVSLRDRQLHIGLSAAQCPVAGKPVAQIYSTLQTLALQTSDFEEVEMVFVYGLHKPKEALWQRKFPLPKRGTTATSPSSFSFNHNLIVFPIISFVAIVFNQFPLTQFLLVGIKIWIHEWGHATIAWLAGHKAIPLPFGWTSIDEERSLWVYLGILILLGLLLKMSWQEQRRWPIGLTLFIALLQGWMTWFMPEDTYQILLAFGGIGGEFYLSTLIMVSFFFPLPDYFRWDFYRFPFVFCAAFTFWGSLDLWHKIDRGKAFIPWGTLWGGEDDSGGDMNTLVEYGWSRDYIIDTYNAIGSWCLMAILGIYIYIIFQQNRAFLRSLWQNWNDR